MQKKIGLALAGGGVKGSYQIGSYYAFKECHIKFDGIVGTSIGAANGAALVSGNAKELYEMWKSINPGDILELDEGIVKFLNDNKFNKSLIKKSINNIGKIVKNRGVSTENLRKMLKKMINLDALYSSNMDYGLATYNYSKKKPIYIFKEDIERSNLIDYVVASCSLPLFKLDKMIDDSIYLDGGFVDVCPSIMLVNKGYDLVYEIIINGIGIHKPHIKSNTKIITISPSRSNGSVLELNHKRILDNLYMGYYDTLKALGKYDGIKYTFKRPFLFNYKRSLRNVDKSLIKFLKIYFKAKNSKELILKVLDKVLYEQKYEYNQVYSIRKVIKELPNKNRMLYKFLKELNLWF